MNLSVVLECWLTQSVRIECRAQVGKRKEVIRNERFRKEFNRKKTNESSNMK